MVLWYLKNSSAVSWKNRENSWLFGSEGRSLIYERKEFVSCIIMDMQKFQHADWLRARQLIPNGAEG